MDQATCNGRELIALTEQLAEKIRNTFPPPAEGMINERDRTRVVEDALRARAARTRFLPSVEFGEPAWDMLLELYLAESRGQKLSVSSLCIASGSSATTAMRWIATMVQSGALMRAPDLADRRRVLIGLTDSTRRSLERWIDDQARSTCST